MTRTAIGKGALALVIGLPGLTCDAAEEASRAPEVTTVALELEALVSDLAPAACGLARLEVGGRTIDLPSEAADLPGLVAVPAADVETLSLVTGACGEAEVAVDASGGDVVVVTPRWLGGHLWIDTKAPVVLPADTRFAVTWRDAGRGPGDLPALGANPAEVLASLLRDPAVASVAPYTGTPSAVDALGPLAAAPREAVRSEDGPWLDLDPDAAAEAPRRAREASVPAFLYYFSYCDCAKPAPGRAFEATIEGGGRAEGVTDRFGLVVLPGVAGAAIDLGPGTRPRERAYAFDPQAAGFEAAVLAALDSADANERLTALVDLRERPVPAAAGRLAALLDHPETSAWLNAAIALSRLDDEAATLAGRWEAAAAQSGADAVRVAGVLGALRQRSSVPALSVMLHEGPAEARAVAAWALGVIAAPEGRPALEAARRAGNPALAADVAQALERVEAAEAMR